MCYHHTSCIYTPFAGEDDLVDVMEQVIDVASKWMALGLALRLKASELDTIKAKHQNDPTACLRHTLLAWLQQKYDTEKYGPPSWDFISKAVRKRTGVIIQPLQT